MSDLIAIAYPDHAAVERARENLRKASTAGLMEVEDAVVMIRHEDGKLEIRQGSTGVGMAAAGGAMFGGAIGLVFLGPLFGMAAGALAAGAAWKGVVGDVGVSESFVTELAENLAPGSAALIVLVREMDPEQVIPRMEVGGRVIQTSLSKEAEEQLDAALAALRGEATSGSV